MREGKPHVVDIGINRYEENDETATHFTYRSEIEDLGDLSTFHGLEEIDATGLQLTPVKVYDQSLTSPSDLDTLDLLALRAQGIVAFRIQQPDHQPLKYSVHLLYNRELPATPLKIGQSATFLLKKADQAVHIIVNGFK